MVTGREGTMVAVGDVLCRVLVGRQAELGALDDALAAALGGAGRLMFVTGEPGIGKSRLARELADRARALGAVVVTGRATPSDSNTPYRPLTEALLAALRDRPLGDEADLRPWRPAMAAFLPGDADQARPIAADDAGRSGGGRIDAGPNASGPGEPSEVIRGGQSEVVPGEASAVVRGGQSEVVPGEASAVVRGEAVLRLLRWLARPGGLMVVLEDLHWADPDTLAVLEYLGDNLGALPVLCVATSRDEPVTEALGLARRLQARHAAGHLALGRLDDHQVTTMVRACLSEADEDVLARVRRTADGVPFLIEEVLASPGVPASVRDTVRARLSALSDAERLVLGAAAVLGRHFDWRLLGRVTGEPPDVVADALERGVEQVLLSVDDGEFRFRHALTREATVAAVLPPRRAALAASALAALEDAHPGWPGPYRAVGADLALQAGDPERAGTLLCASGRESLRRGALATAVETLSRAAGLLGDTPRRGEAEAALVEALALAGRIEEAMAVGAVLTARLGADPAAERTRAQVHLWLAHAAVAATRWPVARAQLAEADGLIGVSGNRDLLAEVLVLRAEVALAAGEVSQARALADRVLDLPEGRAEVRCQALEIIGRGERPRDLAAAQDAFERALGIAVTHALPLWRLRALHELGTIELYRHNGADRLSQARQQAEELGAMSTAAVLDLQLAAAADGRFELDELARFARESLAISERLGLEQVRAKALLFLVESCALRGDREGTERYAAQALAAPGGDRQIEAFVWGAGRGMLALLQDDQAGAIRAFERSAEILRDVPQPEPASFRGVRLLVLAATGDQRAAGEIEAARQSGLGAAFTNRGQICYAEAILAGRAGNGGRAGELAEAGEGYLAPYPVWSDLPRMYAAEAALADGWGEPRRWLEAARASFAAHGLQRLASRCEARLHGAVPPAWASRGVTAREADVLRLVAEGLANKEIATRLYLSPRTIEKHVESLLRKTGARSRTQLVALTGPADE
jgi:DNA-binding CsgD family transcriptional regulator